MLDFPAFKASIRLDSPSRSSPAVALQRVDPKPFRNGTEKKMEWIKFEWINQIRVAKMKIKKQILFWEWILKFLRTSAPAKWLSFFLCQKNSGIRVIKAVDRSEKCQEYNNFANLPPPLLLFIITFFFLCKKSIDWKILTHYNKNEGQRRWRQI